MDDAAPRLTIFCLGSNFTCIGPRRISAYCKSSGIAVRIVFVPCDRRFALRLEKRSENELIEFVKNDTVIGFSFFSNHVRSADYLTALIKSRLQAPVIWGGVHATAAPEDAIKRCDALCIGEGEEALCDYVHAVARGSEERRIENIWFRTGEGVVKNSMRPLIDDLDRLPYQDFDGNGHYLLTARGLRRMMQKDLKRNFGFQLTRLMTFGCPYRCTYCINNLYHSLYGRKGILRQYSVDYFIGETRHILERLPFIHYLLIDDDAFLSLPKRTLEEFCAKFREKINLPFAIGGISPEAINREKLSMLMDAGLMTVRMGIQSGSERTNREIFERQFSREKILEGAKTFKSFGRRLRPAFFDVILDNPWETVQDRLATLDLLQAMPRPYILQAFSLTFFPGTNLYKRAIQEKIIDGFDPEKHFYGLNKNLLTILTLFSGFLRYPAPLYRWAVKRQALLNGKRQYPLLYNCYVALNLLVRLLSFYARPKFLAALFRRIPPS